MTSKAGVKGTLTHLFIRRLKRNWMRRVIRRALIVGLALIAVSAWHILTSFEGALKRQRAFVIEVIDGDTIVIEGGVKVRLIGINAPERGEEYYEEAKSFLMDKILYREVILERDVDDKDAYGRILRYVWLNDELINAEIVRLGLAVAKVHRPNVKYQHLIEAAEHEAKVKRVGLWS